MERDKEMWYGANLGCGMAPTLSQKPLLGPRFSGIISPRHNRESQSRLPCSIHPPSIFGRRLRLVVRSVRRRRRRREESKSRPGGGRPTAWATGVQRAGGQAGREGVREAAGRFVAAAAVGHDENSDPQSAFLQSALPPPPVRTGAHAHDVKCTRSSRTRSPLGRRRSPFVHKSSKI